MNVRVARFACLSMVGRMMEVIVFMENETIKREGVKSVWSYVLKWIGLWSRRASPDSRDSGV